MSLFEKMLAAALKVGAKEAQSVAEDAQHRIQQVTKKLKEVVNELGEIAGDDDEEDTKR